MPCLTTPLIGTSIIFKYTLSQFHLPDAPNLPLIIRLVIREPQTTLASLRVSPLPGLIAQPQHDALEIILHATFRIRGQIGSRTGHVLVKDFALLVNNAEEGEEGCFGGELDGDDGVADAGEDLRGEEGEVRFYEVQVEPAESAYHHERESAFVNRVTRPD